MRGILTYHSIDETASVISVGATAFRAHMRWLANADVEVTTVGDLMSAPTIRNAVAITFDDAFENFATQAWPVLREFGLPATLFVVTGFAGGTNAWEMSSTLPTLPLLDWDALGKLADDGLELAAHSVSHPDLRVVSDAALNDEVVGSVERIEMETGRRPIGFAFPYGACDRRVVDAVQGACGWACTTVLRPLGRNEDRHRLPRLDAYYLRRPGRLETWGPRLQRYLRLRAVGRQVRQAFRS